MASLLQVAIAHGSGDDDTPAGTGQRGQLDAPLHPVHRGKLVTEVPFPVKIDLDALVGF
ncbi:hypothetical protein ACFV2H_38535 [Streptomyces sp. NPDC059629]|uniref:hypothetical protein n=1 Tax=Streptomyces sp. NPDC059629 TaxID=3346889 RepID=UPI00368E12E3